MCLQSVRFLSACALVTFSIACSQRPIEQQSAARSKTFTPPAQPYKFDEEDGQWPMPAKNYSSTRFSGLTDINTSNTALDAASGSIAWWAYSTGPDADCLIGPRFKPGSDHRQTVLRPHDPEFRL